MTVINYRKDLTTALKNLRFLFSTIILCFFFVAAGYAQEEVIWMQSYGSGSVADFGPSQKAGTTQYATDQALADDINLTGTITRVDVRGYASGNSSPTPSSAHYYGLLVKFYAFDADNKPGALQAEYFVPKNSPNFLFQSTGLGDLRVRLEPAFQATGRHFMSAQLVMDTIVIPGSGGATAKWYWRSDDATPVREQGFYYRENATASWTRTEENHGNRNLSMRLWGTRILNTPPVISQLSVNSLPQAGRLKITGTNFGNTQGASVVRIGGAIAPVSNWTETSVTAYVSDASTLGAGNVEITTEGGTSNQIPFTVTARPTANGRVKWRFQADAFYFQGRAAVGTDGTVYAADVGGHLYALTPDGGVKWIFRGKFPVVQSVGVGADNTAYFTGGNVIYAINADGSLKWQITNPTGASVAAGPNVGPDGNIYAVFDLGDQNNPQFGAITISPAGQILNDRPGYFQPRGAAFGTREIVFGSNQFYFGGLNNVVFNTTGLEFFSLGGNYIRTVMAGGSQAAIAPDGTVHVILGANPGSPPRLGVFSPTNGSLLRTILTQETYLTTPDIGADGTIYAAHSLSTLSAYTPTGARIWDFTPGGSIFGSAIVNPQNTVVTVSGYDFSEPGVIYGVSSGGQSVWTVNLPEENGGYVRAISRARFTPDGNTVYYGMDVNDYANDIYTYLYAIDASPNLPCSFAITPSNASSPYNGGTGRFEIQATNQNCQWTAASSASWITVLNPGGNGNGTINYTVSGNPGFTARTGTITVGGRAFTVTQAPRTTTTRVEITYPASGQIFTLPTDIFISANSNNANGAIARVEFYANGELIGTDNHAPYRIVWNDPAATTYTLIAKSIDGNGVVTESEPVTITVNPVPPPEPAPLPVPPPTLTSPTANQQFIQGENITFSATPGASQYPTARVEFYLDTTLVGSDDTSPYGFTLENVPAGIYTASARTVAVTGARATSQPIDISVTSKRTSFGAKPFDFDGDGKADLSIFRPTGGEWWMQKSSGGASALQFGSGTDKIVSGDYTGDGKIDVAVWRGSTGQWFVLRSENFSFYAFPFGANGDVPVPADYDGDGKTDAAVFRPSNNGWYIQKSSGGVSSQIFGQTGDKPVAADFDGDGKTDIAIYRPASGQWWIRKSSNGTVYALQFGDSNDKIVPADYTGDGKADIALFRPSNGFWYILRSEDNSFYGFQFGANGDVPVSADYDGDGKTDAAIFRNGVWHLLQSSAGYTAAQFGIASDLPVPSTVQQ